MRDTLWDFLGSGMAQKAWYLKIRFPTWGDCKWSPWLYLNSERCCSSDNLSNNNNLWKGLATSGPEVCIRLQLFFSVGRHFCSVKSSQWHEYTFLVASNKSGSEETTYPPSVFLQLVAMFVPWRVHTDTNTHFWWRRPVVTSSVRWYSWRLLCWWDFTVTRIPIFVASTLEWEFVHKKSYGNWLYLGRSM